MQRVTHPRYRGLVADVEEVRENWQGVPMAWVVWQGVTDAERARMVALFPVAELEEVRDERRAAA